MWVGARGHAASEGGEERRSGGGGGHGGVRRPVSAHTLHGERCWTTEKKGSFCIVEMSDPMLERVFPNVSNHSLILLVSRMIAQMPPFL